MVIRYIRENKTEKSKGNPIGIIIALDKDHIGWSLKNKKDKWNKDIGKQIAINRAKKGINIPEKKIINGKIEKVIDKIVRVQNLIKENNK